MGTQELVAGYAAYIDPVELAASEPTMGTGPATHTLSAQITIAWNC